MNFYVYFWLINNTTALETVHEKTMQNYAGATGQITKLAYILCVSMLGCTIVKYGRIGVQAPFLCVYEGGSPRKTIFTVMEGRNFLKFRCLSKPRSILASTVRQMHVTYQYLCVSSLI